MTYDTTKREAQGNANKMGVYYRIRKDHFGDYYAGMVPWPRNQYGSDLEGELGQPDKWVEEHHVRSDGSRVTV